MCLYLARCFVAFWKRSLEPKMMLPRPILASLLIILLTGAIPCATVSADALKLHIASPAISQGAPIPNQFACSGANQSPPLMWSEVPPSAKSLALLVEDPDAP